MPWSIKAQLQGRPGPEAGAIFQAWAQLPISEAEFMEEQSALQRQHFPGTQPLPGVIDLLDQLEKAGVHMALATSSHKINYKLKTDHLNSLFERFPDRQKVLGDDQRIPKGRGKPAPDIYLLALETINEGLREKGEKEIRKEECLVFEDSVPGVESGRRAGMRVVWCPHKELLREYKGREADVLAGLTGEHKEEGEVATIAKEVGGLVGWPGKVGDGWAVFLPTLEQFPYEMFRIDIKG